MTSRTDSSSDSLRRLQTEFLVQFDGAATSSEDKITIIGATNLPQGNFWPRLRVTKISELDEAVLRRFPKRIHIPLPTDEDRQRLLALLLKNQKHSISDKDLRLISAHLEGYSSSDITQLAKDAAMAPLRELSAAQVQK